MSGRTLPAGLDAALSAVELAPVFFVELDWPTGTIYLWNGYHTVAWNGQNWLGLGHLGSISAIKESSDLAANGVQLSLSGIPSALIAEALANNSQGRPARIYFGVLTATGFTIDPYCVFDGLIDNTNINSDGKTATITVNLEKELFDDRSDARRWTDQDQQIDYPGDLGFEYGAAIASKTFTWGKATVYSGGAGAGGGDDNINPELGRDIF